MLDTGSFRRFHPNQGASLAVVASSCFVMLRSSAVRRRQLTVLVQNDAVVKSGVVSPICTVQRQRSGDCSTAWHFFRLDHDCAIAWIALGSCVSAELSYAHMLLARDSPRSLITSRPSRCTREILTLRISTLWPPDVKVLLRCVLYHIPADPDWPRRHSVLEVCGSPHHVFAMEERELLGPPVPD